MELPCPASPDQARFIAKIWVHSETGCWEWLASKTEKGYGRFRVGGRAGRVVRAHVFAYEWLMGPVPDGKELHHTCDNKGCANPAHVQPVTDLEHRAIEGNFGAAAANTVKTHCPKGHDYTPGNTRHYRGRRYCRACHNERSHARSGESYIR